MVVMQGLGPSDIYTNFLWVPQTADGPIPGFISHWTRGFGSMADS